MTRDDAKQLDDLEEAAGQAASSQERAKRPLGVRIAIVALVALVAVALFLVGVFAGDRWFRNDEADLQGTWYVAGTSIPVAFEGGAIRLSDDVSYEYDIDSASKTITYRMANLSGEGRYWFSPDRNYLFIEDGSFDALDTLVADVGRMPAEASALLTGSQVAIPEGQGYVALARTAQVQEPVAEPAEQEVSKPREPEGTDESQKQAEEPGQEAEAEAEPDVADAGVGKVSDGVFAEVGDLEQKEDPNA